MVAKIKLLQAFDARRSDLMAVLGNDTVCSLWSRCRLALQQSGERAWPTPIMDLRPILRFAFACRVLQADLDVGKKTVCLLQTTSHCC